MLEDMDKKYEDVITHKIGEVSSRANVNKETVPYYEKMELIPGPDRRRSGYRIFTQRHIDQIRFIKRAQDWDLPSVRSRSYWNCAWMRILPVLK